MQRSYLSCNATAVAERLAEYYSHNERRINYKIATKTEIPGDVVKIAHPYGGTVSGFIEKCGYYGIRQTCGRGKRAGLIISRAGHWCAGIRHCGGVDIERHSDGARKCDEYSCKADWGGSGGSSGMRGEDGKSMRNGGAGGKGGIAGAGGAGGKVYSVEMNVTPERITQCKLVQAASRRRIPQTAA